MVEKPLTSDSVQRERNTRVSREQSGLPPEPREHAERQAQPREDRMPQQDQPQRQGPQDLER